MRAIEKPSTVGLLPALDDMQGIPDARVGLGTGVPEVVERTEDVVVIAGRERELQERGIRSGRGPRNTRRSPPGWQPVFTQVPRRDHGGSQASKVQVRSWSRPAYNPDRRDNGARIFEKRDGKVPTTDRLNQPAAKLIEAKGSDHGPRCAGDQAA